MLDHQNNYKNSLMSKAVKHFDILVTGLRVLCNYLIICW